MRAGRVFTHRVEFKEGQPDGLLTWALTEVDGTPLETGSVSPIPDAVSAVITIPAELNGLDSGELIGGRELSWTYSIASISYAGDVRYVLEQGVPFPVTAQGVRDKLGVEAHELPDEAIPLMTAYLEYRDQIAIDDIQNITSRQTRLVVNALEALAALTILPTLQVRLAARETSGTNEYARYAKINWELLESALRGYVAAASVEFSPSTGSGLFMLAGPATDPVTGENLG